jgi:hypothetical protein
MMSEKEKSGIDVKVGYSSLSMAILVFFVCLALYDARPRIDCALGIQKSCEHISRGEEYQPKVTP